MYTFVFINVLLYSNVYICLMFYYIVMYTFVFINVLLYSNVYICFH